MTEESYQRARKLMQQINYLRGQITAAKGDVAKWTKIEDLHRREGSINQAEGARKALDRALALLESRRAKFAALKFPPDNLPAVPQENVQCENCGAVVGKGVTYCDECLK